MNKFEVFIAGFISILDGLAKILSLGYWAPSFEMTWCVYCTRKAIRKEQGLRNEIEALKQDVEKALDNLNIAEDYITKLESILWNYEEFISAEDLKTLGFTKHPKEEYGETHPHD